MMLLRAARIGMLRTLKLGFGGLLLLILFSGVSQLGVIRAAREADRQARTAYFERARVLDQLRDSVFLTGTFARDRLRGCHRLDAGSGPDRRRVRGDVAA